jgi:hypothetical protein
VRCSHRRPSLQIDATTAAEFPYARAHFWVVPYLKVADALGGPLALLVTAFGTVAVSTPMARSTGDATTMP